MSKDLRYEKSKEDFEKKLAEVFASIKDIPELLQSAMHYSLIEMKGKRIRPVLFLESYKMFGGELNSLVYNFAAAIEMVHNYTLIHDDLPSMDNDDFRKGIPSNHKKFGEGVAILAGDALLNLAYELMLDCIEKSADKQTRFIRATSYFSKCIGPRGLIAGQVVDITSTNDSLPSDVIKFIYRHKTGDLIISSCVCGAILAGASEAEIEIMLEFGDYFSYAFQIKDDLLDIKDKTKREKEGKEISFVKAYGKSRSSLTLGDSTNKAIKSLEKLQNREASFFRTIALMFSARKI